MLCAAAAAGAERFLIGDEAERVYIPYYGGGGYEAVRCMEVIRVTDGLVAGEITRWEWYGGELEETTGKFNRFRVRLCHTSRSELAPPYSANYEGRTPAQVFYADPVTTTMRIREWFGFDLNPTFHYDGTNNLIVEVWWEGDDNGGGYVFTAYVVAQLRCLLSSIKNGVPQDGYPDEGLACYWLHYMRVTLSPDAVEPTSLGRVKAMYR
jgi:hypothetical protein